MDVRSLKIVELEAVDLSKLRYVALSYVWGGPQKATLLKENRIALQQDGALKGLPKTLADAIAFTAALQIQYIWIDAICIIQDSNEDKAIQIGNMANIYSYSLITLVAATGTNANSGLPGVSKPRDLWQIELRVPVAEQDMPMRLVTSMNRLTHEDDNFLTGSIWSSRGWTFQERGLAPRIVAFTEDQVYWVCEGGYGIEETDTRSGSDIARCDWRHMEEPRALRLNVRKAQPANEAVHDPYALRECIDYYQSKSLTNKGDAFDAFSAILQSIEDRTGETFLWGLARSTFDTGIWWDRSLEDGTITRRTCLTTLKVTSLKQHVSFPSWTWLGWERAASATALMYARQ